MTSPQSPAADRTNGTPSAEEIRNWILAQLRTYTGRPEEELRSDQPIMSFGVDSMQLVGMIGELEEWLGCRILDNPLPQYPTTDALSTWLASEIASGKTKLNPTASPPAPTAP